MSKLNKNQRQFLYDYRATGGDLTLLQNEKGYSLVRINRFLNNIEVKKHIANNLNYCKEALNKALPSVLGNLLEMQSDNNVPFSVRANIALQLLDKGGLSTPKEPQITVNINTSISDRARNLLAERLSEVEDAEIIEPEPLPTPTPMPKPTA